jgi:hypothetical protein
VLGVEEMLEVAVDIVESLYHQFRKLITLP